MRRLLTVWIAALAAGCGESGPDWSELAARDIRAAHEMVLASHPGPVDPEAPGFVEMAKTSLERALTLATRAETASGYAYATRAYAAGFRDPHISFKASADLEALRARMGDVQWAGLFIGWREGVARVTAAEDGAGAAKGEQLVSCGGRSFEQLMREDVFPYSPMPADIPAAWTFNTPAALRDSGNPFVQRPKACVFRDENGEHEVELQWRSLTTERYQQLVRSAMFGKAPAAAVREIEPGVWWITLPTFNPADPVMIRTLRGVIATIRNSRTEMLASRAVVFDVRGNTGGQSSWASDALQAFYGAEYAAFAFQRDVRVFWRAEASNAQSVRDRIKELASLQPDMARGEEALAKRMDEAIAAGTPLLPGASSRHPDVPPRTLVANPAKAQVFLLTDGMCMSSCLIFADMLMSIKGVRHIGYPTGADTDYTSVRLRDLPSGQSQFIHPVMIWRDPERKSGVFHSPEKTFSAFDWTDESVEEWFRSDVLGSVPD